MSITVTFDPTDPISVQNAKTIIAAFTVTDKEPVAATDTPAQPALPEPVVATETDPRIGVETDTAGTPWLEEVHAGTKSKTSAGRWTKKRGVDAEIVEAAEKAARAKLAGTPEPEPQPEVVVEQTTRKPVDYQELVAKYVELAGRGVIDNDRMLAIYEECGTNGNELATNETARAAVMEKLESLS